MHTTEKLTKIHEFDHEAIYIVGAESDNLVAVIPDVKECDQIGQSVVSNPETRVANAKLFIAAPEMLKGLNEAKTIIYNLTNNMEKRSGVELQAIFDEIIIKATK